MKRIVSPLKLQMKRSQVADLQEALTLIGLQIADVEKDSRRFGTSTRDAVRKFQSDHSLPVTGIVDEATATVLNSLMAERGALDAEVTYVVKGIVRGSEGKFSPELMVQAFDRDVSRVQLLGSAVTDKDGAYRITFPETKFKQTDAEQGGPELFIRITDHSGKQLFQSKTIKNAPLEVSLDVVLPPIPTKMLVVRGRVTTSEGNPASNYTVKAFDRNMGENDTFLGEAKTDIQGSYAIICTSETLAGKTAADMVIVLYQGEKLLQTSDVIFNAEQETMKDFIIPLTPSPEFERLTAKIKPLLHGGVGLGKLDIQQITFLKQKINVNASKIEQINHACELANGDKELEEFYYALLSDDLPITPEAILARDRTTIVRAIKRATVSNLVSPTVASQMDQILDEKLPRLRALNLLKPAAVDLAASLGDLLDTLPEADKLDEDARLAFAISYGKHGNADPLWEAQGTGTYAASIPVLKRTLALNEIALGHKPLVAALQERCDAGEPESVAYLASLSSLDWLELTLTQGAAPNSQATPIDFAVQMESSVEQRFPTDVFRERLASGNIRIKDFPALEVVKLLADHKDFNLRQERADDFLERIGAKTPELSAALRKVQRVLPLAGDLRASAALLNAGFDSAFSIARKGLSVLTARVAGELTQAQAKEIHAAARDTMATSLAICARYSPRFNPQAIEAIPYSKPSTAFLDKYPNLRNLFGDLDYCACRHCESVLGPAAYLADLLHFLELSGNSVGNFIGNSISTSRPFWAFHIRRPDLANLLLTCDNTNTEIPYIDLVLEVLENQVALPNWFKVTTQDSVEIHAAILRGELPDPIRNALAKTAVMIGAKPEVTQLTTSDLPIEFVRIGIIAPSQPFFLQASSLYMPLKVTDGAREWSVIFIPKGLWMDNPGAQALKLYAQGNAEVDEWDLSLSRGEIPSRVLAVWTNGWIPCSTQVKFLSSSNESDDKPRFTSYEVSISLGFDLVAIHIGRGILVIRYIRTDDGTVVREKVIPKLNQNVVLAWLDGNLAYIFRTDVLKLLEIPDLPWTITHPEPRRCTLRVEVPKYIIAISYPMLGVLSLTYRSSSVQTDLAAVPENLNPAAYQVLSKAVYPWTLPFDLPTTEIRAYLTDLGVSRQKLMEISGLEADSDGFAREVLGLTKPDKEPVEIDPWRVWDLKPSGNSIENSAGDVIFGSWTEVLRNVSIVLERSGLTFRELLDLRQTGHGTISWSNITPKGECHPAKMTWKEIDEAQLAWIHAFTRLWRRIGWSMRDLNCGLTVVCQHPADVLTSPKRLSLLGRLHTRLNQPILYVAAMLGYMELRPWLDHTKEGEPIFASLFDSVFQRSALRASESFSLFAVNVESGELAYLDPALLTPKPDKKSLNVHSHFLAASLGITPNQVERLIASLHATNELTVSNLTRLLSAVAYCRSLRLSVEDFIRWIALLGDPFAETDLESRAKALLKFADDIELARDSKASLDELDYLLRHDPNGEFVDIETRMLEVLSRIREALQKGAVLGDISIENLVIQLRRLGASESLLASISDEASLLSVLKAEILLDSLSTPLPELPIELGSRFYYRKNSENELDFTVWLGCRGIIDELDFTKLPLPLPLRDALRCRYEFIREALVSQVSRIGKQGGNSSNPVIPQLEVILETASIVSLPEDLQSIFTLREENGIRKFTMTGVLSPEQYERDTLKSILPGLTQSDLEALSKQAEAAINSSTSLIEPNTVHKLLARRSATEIREALLALIPVLDLDLLTSQLSGLFELDLQVIQYLLTNVRVSRGQVIGSTALELLTAYDWLMPDITQKFDPGKFPEQLLVAVRMHKAAQLLRSDSLTVRQLDLLNGKSFDVLAFNDLPSDKTTCCQFARWRALKELMQFKNSVEGGATIVQALADLLLRPSVPGDAFYKQAAPIFANAYTIAIDEVKAACELLSAKTKQDFSRPSRLLQLIGFLHLLKLLGTTAEVVKGLIGDAPGVAEAMTARKLFMAQFDPEMLSKRLAPISDKLRIRQRDALISYLKWRDRLPDDNALLDYYFIDVKMEPCMRTSRIKQAISSVQLFIQRCMLNLEKYATIPVLPGDIDATEWRWMKNYRVWEANRKVFLYPENWIEPDLRDDKSGSFSRAQNWLIDHQHESEAGEESLGIFVDDIREIGTICVVGSYKHIDELADSCTLYVVGRTPNQSGKFYWRICEYRSNGGRCWTPWQELQIAIESTCVIPFVLAGCFYVAWPVVTTENDKPTRLRLAWGRRTTRGWVGAMISTSGEVLLSPLSLSKDERLDEKFILRLRTLPQSTPSVKIDAWRIEPTYANAILTFIPQPGISSKLKPGDYDLTYNEVVRLLGQGKQLDEVSSLLGKATFTVRSYEKCISGPNKWFRGMNSKIAIVYTGISKYDYLYNTVNEAFTFGREEVQVDENCGGEHTFELDWAEFEYGSGEPVYLLKVEINITAPNGATAGVIYGVRSDNDPDEAGPFLPNPIGREMPESYRFEHCWGGELTILPKWQPTYVGCFTLDAFDNVDKTTTEYPSLLEVEDCPPANDGYEKPDGITRLTLPAGHLLDQLILIDPVHSERSFLTRAFDKQTRASSAESLPMDVWYLGGATSQRYIEIKGSPTIRWESVPDTIMATVEAGISCLPAYRGGQVLGSGVQNSIDFLMSSPAGPYNWELYFHLPLLIAVQLSTAQRFEEAQRWFHTIFDPTSSSNELASVRYWRFPPFRKAGQGDGIDYLLELLAKDDPQSEEEQQTLEALRVEINAWKYEPFNPHLIARSRIRAYQWTVVIKYIENLIAWGDLLFRRDTIESINEATQLYVLAVRILGQRPASIPRCKAAPRSYFDLAHLLANGFDEFSNAFVTFEDVGVGTAFASLSSTHEHDLIKGLYFCIPPNSEIEALWQKVDERLFNIRHCRNIEGIGRQLPLFEPPIDPALLVKAAAAGLDISAVLSDLAAPLPLYRFNVVLQKAIDVCGELRLLGSALLAALEKNDAEALSLLRSSHEVELLSLSAKIRELQIKETELAFEGLRESRKTAEVRYQYYQKLLGRNEITLPQPGSILSLETVPLNLAKSGLDSDQAGLGISQTESEQFELLRLGQQSALASGIASTTAGVLFAIGGILSAMPRGSSPGPNLGDMGGPLTGAGQAANAISSYLATLSGYTTSQAGMKGIIASYERRRIDWIFQSNMALRELQQIDKQIAAAEIRIAIANQELVNIQKQAENTLEADEFMRSKFTNRELYRWMSAQLSSLYFNTYRLAHELAKRAERCFQFELGDEGTSYIKFGYWDSLKKGLLAGEQLHQDLKRLDIAYIERNKREYEITRHVSLLQLNPEALITLRESHVCEFTIPEWLFDMDCPGHFMRRIKLVSLSVPCVTGPYTGVHCVLTLLSSVVRISNSHESYGEVSPEDTQRFRFDYSRIQSIVTSSGQSDSGMFEPNLRDERYLPFEGAGAISTWRLELPAAIPQFDYSTISDIVLHLRYTAREGGSSLRNAAAERLSNPNERELHRLFSIRQEFPIEWAAFKVARPVERVSAAELCVELKPEHYPYWSGLGQENEEVNVLLCAKPSDMNSLSIQLFDGVNLSNQADENGTMHPTLQRDPALSGLLVCRLKQPIKGKRSLFFASNSIDDLWMIVSRQGK